MDTSFLDKVWIVAQWFCAVGVVTLVILFFILMVVGLMIGDGKR